MYWMVGMNTSPGAFFIFLSVLIVFTMATTQMLSICASIAPSKSVVLALSSLILVILMLFSGFIVSPDVIPNYFLWLYWWNPLAWAYRAVLINEFSADKYDYVIPGTDGLTKGEAVLLNNGFEYQDGVTFGQEWIAYCFAYLLLFTVFCGVLTGIGLHTVRPSEQKFPPSAAPDDKVDRNCSDEGNNNQSFQLPCMP